MQNVELRGGNRLFCSLFSFHHLTPDRQLIMSDWIDYINVRAERVTDWDGGDM